MVFLKIIIGVYALLMIAASVQSMVKEHDTKKTFHYINFLISLCLVLSLIFATHYYLIFSVSILLIGYQILAMYRGVSTHSLHWQHHIVRLIATIAIIILCFVYFR